MRRRAPTLLAALIATAAAAEDLPPPLVSAVPIPEGQVAMAIGRIDALVGDVMARTGIPGIAVGVVADGKLAFAEGYGVRTAGGAEAVDADTLFQLASVSKSVAATVVAAEIAAERVAWSTPMTELLPWFRLSEPEASALVTVGDLFAHRSGLPDHAGDDLEDLGYGRLEVMERLAQLPLEGFRDHYAYTNFGLTAAAEAVATAAGTDWATLSQTVLYAPLGMTRTSSRFADYIAAPNRAVPHMRTPEGAWAPLAQRQPDAQSPAGGVASTATDMARWMALVLGTGSLDGAPRIDEAALLPALSPQAVSGSPPDVAARPSFYGYGVGYGIGPSGRVMLSHSGGFNLGAGTTYLLIPSAGVGIIVLTNAQPIGGAEAISLAFADLVQFGSVTRDWLATVQPLLMPLFAPIGHLAGAMPPADATPAREPTAYAGTYVNAYLGRVTVSRGADGLVLTAGPAAVAFPLRHWSGDSFVFEPSGENAPAGSISEVSFHVGDGVADTMTVELWSRYGVGTLTRIPD